METIVIVCPLPYESVFDGRLAGLEASRTEDGVVVSVEGSRVYVSRNDEVRDELSPERLAALCTMIRNPHFYTLDYSDIEAAKRVLLVIADDPQLLIDNDRGTVLPGPEFLELVRKRPDWDWRISREG